MIPGDLRRAICVQVKACEELYNQRWKLRLAPNEVVHLTRRASITPKSNPFEDRDVFYHVFFDAQGLVWHKITEGFDCRLGVDVPYWSEDPVLQRHSNRYVFQDRIEDEVLGAVALALAGEDEVDQWYLWDHAEFDIQTLRVPVGTRMGPFTVAEETTKYWEVYEPREIAA